jgi:predicted RNA methylase
MLGDSGYERRDRDWYATPPETTQAICNWLKQEFFPDGEANVWEPAAGDGAMLDILKANFQNAWGTDIHPLREDIVELDFYQGFPSKKWKFDAIVTNPPYGPDLDKFIERGLSFVRKGAVLVILARNEADSASSRRVFFDSCQEFYGKVTLLWRPRWIADSTGSPRHNYAFYCWAPASWHVGREATIHYVTRP